MPEIELTIVLVIDIMGKCKYNYHKIGARYYLFLTDRHDITEKLLKEALNTITL